MKTVEKGEQAIITKHSRAVAKFTPEEKIISKRKLEQVVKKLKIFNKIHTLDGVHWKKLRDEGRW